MEYGKETNLISSKGGKPWLPANVREAPGPIEYHHRKNREIIGKDIPFIQIVQETGVAERRDPFIYQMSASRLF